MNHFLIFILFTTCSLNISATTTRTTADPPTVNNEFIFFDKNQKTDQKQLEHHIKWISNLTVFPISFEKLCHLDDSYDWLRHSDNQFISQTNEYYWGYIQSRSMYKSKLYLLKYDFNTHKQLSSYEPKLRADNNQEVETTFKTKITAPNKPKDHSDLFTLIYLKSVGILIDSGVNHLNATCVADFYMPNNADESINEAILNEMEKNAIFKMSVKDNDPSTMQNIKDFKERKMQHEKLYNYNPVDIYPMSFRPYASIKKRQTREKRQNSDQNDYLQVRLSMGPMSVFRGRKESLLTCGLGLLNKDDVNLDFHGSVYKQITTNDFRSPLLHKLHDIQIEKTFTESNLHIAPEPQGQSRSLINEQDLSSPHLIDPSVETNRDHLAHNFNFLMEPENSSPVLHCSRIAINFIAVVLGFIFVL